MRNYCIPKNVLQDWKISKLWCLPLYLGWKISKFLDSQCDDLYNYEKCMFDHGDCCRPIIDGAECESCICHEDGQVHLKIVAVKYINLSLRYI